MMDRTVIGAVPAWMGKYSLAIWRSRHVYAFMWYDRLRRPALTFSRFSMLHEDARSKGTKRRQNLDTIFPLA